MLKLIESIYYHYSPKRFIAEIAWLIRIVITKTKEFVKGNTSYMIFVNFKKKKEKDRALISIFKSFLRKLSKEKGYILVENLKWVEDLD